MNVRFYLSHDIKITVKSHFWRKKNAIMYAMLLWMSFYNVTKICLLILIHGVISLPDVMSYDKKIFINIMQWILLHVIATVPQ